MRLTGKVALVTGGTAGIGAGIVEMMAREGASVAFTGRSVDTGSALEQRLRDQGLTVAYIRADNTIEDEVRDAVESAVAAFGPVTVLVNSAAATDVTVSGVDNHVDEILNDDWDYIVRTALYGTLWATKYTIPHMRTAGVGSIINISASSSVQAIRSRPAYQASKGAINSLTRQLAIDYGAENIRSNAIIVGFINSGGESMQALLANEQYMGVIRSMLALPHIGEPADIAAAAVYLASDESKYVTGSQLTVDGGATSHQSVPPVTVAAPA
ncbi:MAG: putative short-chain dehydrogenase [Aeromicrobium sp.]|nr:putative short-chain dehydrogenase [Aeromicrobium sp.]